MDCSVIASGPHERVLLMEICASNALLVILHSLEGLRAQVQVIAKDLNEG